MVKHSMLRLTGQFSTNRMVQDYTVKSYMPAVEAYRRLSEEGLDRARGVLGWRDRIRGNWGSVRVVAARDDANVSNLLGQAFQLTAEVELGALTPDDVRVQAVVGKVGPNRELINTRVEDLEFREKADDRYVFSGKVVCDYPGYQGYTVRVVPRHEDVSIPSELNLVAWE